MPELVWLDPQNALHILRILQEALSNIIKHSQASQISIGTAQEVCEGRAGIAVTVTDNGGGVDIEAAIRKGGRGLANQLRRAQAIGAQASWEQSSAGTVFKLWLPLKV